MSMQIVVKTKFDFPMGEKGARIIMGEDRDGRFVCEDNDECLCSTCSECVIRLQCMICSDVGLEKLITECEGYVEDNNEE